MDTRSLVFGAAPESGVRFTNLTDLRTRVDHRVRGVVPIDPLGGFVCLNVCVCWLVYRSGTIAVRYTGCEGEWRTKLRMASGQGKVHDQSGPAIVRGNKSK